MFIKVFTTGPVETNTVLIACPATKKAAIVDAPLESLPLLSQEVEKQNFKVEMLLLTHSHWDHIADAAKIKKKFHIPVYIHADDSGNLEKPGSDGVPMFFPVEGAVPDKLLKDGDLVRLGELEIKVIHTPGHTPGGVCFWIEKEKTLISGDTLFHGTIGRLDLPTGRAEAMWESLRKLAKLPPKTRVFAGHGEETTIGAESWLSDAKRIFGG